MNLKNWNSIEHGIPKGLSGKYKVKIKDGKEIDAFFYEDRMGWIAFYGKKTSHWWEANYPHGRLDDVTHWMKLPDNS